MTPRIAKAQGRPREVEFPAKVRDAAAKRALPPIYAIREALEYDEYTGIVVWKVKKANRIKAGAVAGGIHADGYLKISFNNKNHMLHRMIWALHYGEWPSEQIDHINGIRTDNRLCNLRLATHSENAKNAGRVSLGVCGRKGVTTCRNKTNPYRARIQVDGQQIDLGCHRTIDAAAEAYRKAAQFYFGEFARLAP